MFTGKIYKNKLTSVQKQPNINRTNPQTSKLMRIKSQPQIKYPNNPIKYQNAQSINQVTAKSPRQPIYQNYHIHQTTSTFPKVLLQQAMGNQQTQMGVYDQIFEYERKYQQHIQKIQNRYQAKICQLETTLQAKNQIINQLKTVLKELFEILFSNMIIIYNIMIIRIDNYDYQYFQSVKCIVII